jgi:Endonuclease NucS
VGDEVHIWRVGPGEQLSEIQRGRLDLESRLEEWLKRDISVLDPALLVIGSEVETDGGPIDILCVDAAGDLVIVELKRDNTPRLITAQVLDYASCVATSSLGAASRRFAVSDVTLQDRVFRPEGSKGLHTCPTFENLQIDLKQKVPSCWAFAEPSDGLEPSTPSLPWRCSTN